MGDSLRRRSSAIDAPALAAACSAGADALCRVADALNAINVFPVPDGDTGANMSLTMRAAVDAIAGHESVDAVAQAVASGALMGARGNSGVILSQVLSGVAQVTQTARQLDAQALADALERGRDAAYRVVSAPREGTILTAIAAAASAARDAARSDALVDEVLAAALDAAREATARTPELLPVLRDAGVVDAGAQGLVVLLDGMLRSLRGEEPAPARAFGGIDPDWLAVVKRAHEDGAADFCTEFFINGDGLDPRGIRAHMRSLGDSVLVAVGSGGVRVHLHTAAPEAALSYARSLGALTYENVEDMALQLGIALAGRPSATSPQGPAVVAVASGDGFARLFESLGAVVVHGGATMNPSVGDMRRAIIRTGANNVIVLPNHPNVLLAARQAAQSAHGPVHIVETPSMPHGVAALLAFSPDVALDQNVEAMRTAIASARYAEVTRAARATRLRDLEIEAGQPIGLVDGRLALAEATIVAAARECVELLLAGRTQPLVTLYYGADENDESARALADELRKHLGVEVEVVHGGQAHQAYIIAVE